MTPFSVVLLVCIVFCVVNFSGVNANFPHEIVRFDRHIVKRSTPPSPYERIQFKALGKTFRAVVWPGKAPIHQHFRVIVGSDSFRELPMDVNQLYEGYIAGNSSNRVLLTKLPAGGYMGSISTGEDMIYLEPAQLHFEYADERDIMVYRASNVPSHDELKSMSDVMYMPISQIQGTSPNPALENPFISFRHRHKRQIEPLMNMKKNRCPMKIVADYKFFSIVGKNSTALTTRYIVNMIANVNEIFRKVNWDEGREDEIKDRGRLMNMGFSIKELKILDRPSQSTGHYNGRGREIMGQWNVTKLLTTFTAEESSPKFCLVHLLTAQSFFETGSLGLAYVAMIQHGQKYAGICSSSRYKNPPMFYNTLLTSVVGHSGKKDYPLVTREAEIVVAHEYGHSWGAQHDTNELRDDSNGKKRKDSSDCLPDYSHGGNYIMNAYAQSGYDRNNNKFSPCSIRSIRNVLEQCSPLHFEEEKSSFCGNGVLEEGEECDEGALLASERAWSGCCSRECRLVPSALCSPRNQPCCSDSCLFHNHSHVCMPSNPWQCKGASYCTGSSGECPPPPPVLNGSPCVEEGECRDGNCLPYCERKDVGKKSCICEEVHLSCRRCCRSINGSGLCEPQSGAADLPDGTWCVQGYCKNSKCMNAVADYMTFYLNVLSDGSRVWPFVKSNIVGITVLISMIIWIPCGIWINRIDQRRGRDLVQDASNVHHVNVPRSRPKDLRVSPPFDVNSFERSLAQS